MQRKRLFRSRKTFATAIVQNGTKSTPGTSSAATVVVQFATIGLSNHHGMWETIRMAARVCECGHPEANHTVGRCSTETPMNDDPNRFVLCQCKKFKPKREDFSQAAARIGREATKDH